MNKVNCMKTVNKTNRLRTLLGVTLCAGLLIFGSCSKIKDWFNDDSEPEPLVLTSSEITVLKGDVTVVAVTGDEMPYRVSEGNASIASVSISGNSITVLGISEGTVVVEVVGNAGGKATLKITVSKVNEDGLSKPIADLIPPNIMNILVDLDLPIYGGANPPSINGTYLISPNVLKNSNRTNDNIGTIFAEASLTFSEQDNDKLTIRVNYSQGSLDGEAMGAYIIGEGDKFSVFVELPTDNSKGVRTVSARIFSGTLTSNGIKNEFHSLVMLDDGGDPNDELIEVGDARVFYDSDGLATKTATKSSAVSTGLSDVSSK
ncbi:hypothetical protein FACS189430_09570 [Bacteroidia bacterium]|nr:hypothetical protein FACS189430_09570 [Bacteroidia bacterium]